MQPYLSLTVPLAMNPGYLTLFTASHNTSAAIDEMVNRLESIQLIEAPLSSTPQQFHTGKRFLQLLTFMGCSPAVPLEQNGGPESCTIKLLGPYSAPQLIRGSNTRPPRCPNCRQTPQDWEAQLNTAMNQTKNCPNCGELITIDSLNWRQQGGVGSTFLTISQVFPGEAVPVASLMHCLEEDGSSWDYCYIQGPIQLDELSIR